MLKILWNAGLSASADVLVAASAKTLGHPTRIKRYRPYFFTDGIKVLEWGGTLDTSWEWCHKGFSICAFWVFMLPSNQGTTAHNQDLFIMAATSTLPEHHATLAGKPQDAPDKVPDLLDLINEYIVQSHAAGLYDSDHIDKVRRMETILDEKKTENTFDDIVHEIY